MNQQLTDIVFILDRSGSMDPIKQDAIGGYNQFIEEQRAVPGEARVTLALFDHEYDLIYDAVPIGEVVPLDENTYVPRGWTALYDAIGRTLNTVGARLAKTDESNRPGKVIVAIMTDGHENHSREFSHAQIKQMIEHQQEKYNWEFFFLGANVDAPAVAASIGVPQAGAISYTATSVGTADAYRSIGASVTRSRTGQKT